MSTETFVLIGILIIIYLLWMLLIKGLLWKLIIGIGGWIAIYSYLHNSYAWAFNSGITIFGYIITWDIIIPTFILLMATSATNFE